MPFKYDHEVKKKKVNLSIFHWAEINVGYLEVEK